MANDRELEALARLLYTENRQTPNPDEAAGMVRTVFERQKLQGYPSGVEEILTQPNQYHGFSPPQGNAAAAANAAAGAEFGPNHPDYNKFMTLAQYGWQQREQPMEEPPTHYFTGAKPEWASGMRLTDLGKHSFGREPGRRAKRPQLGSPKPRKKGK